MSPVRRWNLAVQKERLRAERVGTVCHLSGFVTTRMTVAMAQMRRVSVFTCVALTGTDNWVLLKLQHLPPGWLLQCCFPCQEL